MASVKFAGYAIIPLYRRDDRLMTTPASYNVRVVSICQTIASGFKTYDLAAAWLATHIKAGRKAQAASLKDRKAAQSAYFASLPPYVRHGNA